MKIKLKSFNNSITVDGEDLIIQKLENFEFLYQYIPELSVSPDDKVPAELLLEVESNCSTIAFKFSNKKATLSGHFEQTLSLHDIVTVIDYCFDYLRQSVDLYCVHGAAVSTKGKGVLIMGQATGMGKTTLALNLCSMANFRFIGDEKILIGRDGMLVGGIKNITYNKDALKETVNITNGVVNEREPVPLSLVVQPLIFPLTSTLKTEKWSNEKANFHIYEEMTRKIRGISRRISNFSYPLQSIDNSDLSIKRSIASAAISKKVPFYSLWGGLAESVGKIIDIMGNT